MGDTLPQQVTRFQRFINLLALGLPIYEAKHNFPNKWAAAFERIDTWEFEGGNTYTIGTSPDPLDTMVVEYLNFIYVSGPIPYWLKVLEGK